MRSYIVIPEGTSVLRVDASTPQFAASKAKRGKCEHVEAEIFVVPMSAAMEANGRPAIHPLQMRFESAN